MAQKCQILRVKNWSQHKSKTGPIMLRNIIGPIFELNNGQFWPFFVFLKNLILLQEEEDLKEKRGKGKKEESWTNFDL